MLSDSVVQNKHGRQAAQQGKQCQHVSQTADGALAPFPLPVGGLLVLLDIPAATPSQWTYYHSGQISCSSPTGDSESRLSSVTRAQVCKGWLADRFELCNAAGQLLQPDVPDAGRGPVLYAIHDSAGLQTGVSRKVHVSLGQCHYLPPLRIIMNRQHITAVYT